MTTTINTLYQSVVDLRAAVAKEGVQRMEIEQSPEYQEIEQEIQNLETLIQQARHRQAKLTATVPNSQPALEEAEKALFEAMAGEGKEVFGNCRLKYSNKASVNKERLLVELDGDLDLYIRLSNVTQVALKDWIKETGNKSLLSCIETVSTPVGVEFQS